MLRESDGDVRLVLFDFNVLVSFSPQRRGIRECLRVAELCMLCHTIEKQKEKMIRNEKIK